MVKVKITMEGSNTLMVSFPCFTDMLLTGKIRVKSGIFEYKSDINGKYIECTVSY